MSRPVIVLGAGRGLLRTVTAGARLCRQADQSQGARPGGIIRQFRGVTGSMRLPRCVARSTSQRQVSDVADDGDRTNTTVSASRIRLPRRCFQSSPPVMPNHRVLGPDAARHRVLHPGEGCRHPAPARRAARRSCRGASLMSLQLPEASARAFGAACRGTPSSAPAINYRDPVPAVRCPKEAASVRRRPISRRQPNRGQTTGWTARYLAIIKLILGQLSSSNAPADGRCARR